MGQKPAASAAPVNSASPAGQTGGGQADPGHESALEKQQRSILLQQQSIQRQHDSVARMPGAGRRAARHSGMLLPAPGAAFASVAAFGPGSPDCPPVSPPVLENAVEKAAAAYNVSSNLIDAVIHQESGGYPCAVSEKGAMGLMQLMPATALDMGATQPFDIDQNIDAGTRLLAGLIERYQGDLNRVLGAYNAGPVAVDRSGGPPPYPETMHYIRSILDQIKLPSDPKLFEPLVR